VERKYVLFSLADESAFRKFYDSRSIRRYPKIGTKTQKPLRSSSREPSK
jgi:hypothetical protein